MDINHPPQDPSEKVHSDLSGVMDNCNRVKSIDKSVSEEDGGSPSRRTDRSVFLTNAASERLARKPVTVRKSSN